MALEAQAKADAEERVRAVELLISNLLRVGVTLSLGIVLLGTVVTFVHHPEYHSNSGGSDAYRALVTPVAGDAPFPHTLRAVVDGLIHFRGQAIVIFGLMLLIATPIVRVAVSILAFSHERDMAFVAITSVVLALLLVSFLLGKAGG